MLAVTGDVANTASANFCVFRHLTDIMGVMPATRALLTIGFTQRYFQPFEQFALLCIRRRAGLILNLCA